MCGIVYVKRKDGKSAVKSVKKRYKKQKLRGHEGFGYVAIKNDKVVSYQRAPTEHEIMLKLEKEDAPEILFHHRFPTSTPNMEEQAHPLFVSHELLSNQYYVAHNGVIRNSASRKIAHEKLGLVYRTELLPLWRTQTDKLYKATTEKVIFNDSEALAIDVALALEKKIKDIETEGSAAAIVLQIKDGKVIDRIFFRNTLNPLMYEDNNSMTTLTSSGKGKDIDTIRVMRLEGTTPKEHPYKLWSPSTYSPTYTRTYHGGPREDDLDDYAYGYPTYAEEGNVSLKHLVNSPKLPVLFPKKSIGSGVLSATIKGMNDDVLWEEYDKSLATIRQIEDGIQILDNKVNAGIISEGILTGRGRLQDSLDKTNAYKAQLDKEVEERITNNKTRALTG